MKHRWTDNLRSPLALILFFGVAAIGLAADLWAKSAAKAKLDEGEVVRFIPNFLNFTYTENRGAVFGLGQGQQTLFLIVSIGAIGFLVFLFLSSGKSRVYQLILGMLLAGVLGNMYDRVAFGYVRDMIHALPGWHWPDWIVARLPASWQPPLGRELEVFPWIFNIADSLLCTGVAAMLVFSFLSEFRRKHEGSGEAPHSGDSHSRLDASPREGLMPAASAPAAAANRELDEQMMRRAIRLAMTARGRAEPNPTVGSVIAKGARVIGEGATSAFGGAHAEPTALAACTESPAGATAYCTLEPCCHTNKKTPPCVPALIQAKIARVVIGCVDPNPSVNGHGIEQLRSAGIEVEFNVLEDPAKQLIAPFIARTVYDRPYVTLKWAESADGKVAGAGGKRAQISNPAATRKIHELRGRCDAIMVGVNTVIADDPMLTARDLPPGAINRKIFRVVLDSNLNIPLASKLVRTARQTSVFVYFDGRMASAEHERAAALREAGVETFYADRQSHGLNLDQILVSLGGFDATHVLVECGPTLARDFFDRQILADRVWLIRSPNKIDAPDAPAGTPIPGNYKKTGEIDLEGDRLIEFLNPGSPAFFAAEPSADFQLASDLLP